MNRSVICRISLFLCVVGVMAMIIALGAVGFNIFALETSETEKIVLDENISIIQIYDEFADVEIYPSDSDESYIVYPCQDGIIREINVPKNGNQLISKTTDARKWYQKIGLNLNNDTYKVYLSKDMHCYELIINTEDNDVYIDKGVSFYQAEIRTESGDITFKAQAITDLYLHSTDGDITLQGLNGGTPALYSENGDVTVKDICLDPDAPQYNFHGDEVDIKKNLIVVAHNGEMLLDNVVAESISMYSETGTITAKNISKAHCSIQSTDGDINIDNIQNDGDFSAINVNGDISFAALDISRDIYFETVNGDISGTVVGKKVYEIENKNGETVVPESETVNSVGMEWEYICKVITENGDINIEKSE